jgi:ADP-ribosylglycohydrolase
MSSSQIPDRIRGALFGLACGDALGAPVEFMDAPAVRDRYGTLRDMLGGGLWAPGEWTDDTGMTLAVAEGILDTPDDPWRPLVAASSSGVARRRTSAAPSARRSTRCTSAIGSSASQATSSGT